MVKALTPIIGATILVQLIGFVFGITNNVVLSRWLGPELLGLLAIIMVLIEVIYKVSNPGLDTSALYFISNKQFPVKQLLGTYFLNGIVVFLIGILLLITISKLDVISIFTDFFENELIVKYLWVLILYLFAFQFFLFGSQIPLGLQQFNKYNKIQVLRPLILFSSLLFCSLYLIADLWIVLFAISFSLLIPAIIYWKDAFPFQIKWSRKITSYSFSYGIKVMAGTILIFLTYRIDIILIGYFISPAAVGWYFISVVVAEKLLLLTQATGIILLPAASNAIEQQQKTPLLSRVNLFIVFIGAIIIALSAPWVVPFLFSSQYSNSVMPLIVILPGIASLTVSKILSADLSARGLPQFSMYSSIVNFSLNIVLNIILIPRIGITGAALSSTISYTIGMIVLGYYYKKQSGISIFKLIILQKGDLRSLKNI